MHQPQFPTAKLHSPRSLTIESSTTPNTPEILGIMATEVTESEAARFNRIVMRKLQKAIEADPEVDLACRLPTNYSLRLAGRRKENKGSECYILLVRN